MMKIKFLMVTLLVATTTLVAQDVSLEKIMGTPFPSYLASSRNGSQIAWVFNDRGVRNIWFAEAPDFVPRKLTDNKTDDGQEITSLSFTPATSQLIFQKGGAPNVQNELPNPLALQQGVERALYTITFKGEQKKLATGYYPKISPDGKTVAYISGGQIYTVPTDGQAEGKKIFQARGNQQAIRWSPDGNKIAFLSERGDHSFLGIYDLNTGVVSFPDPSVDHDGDPVWSADGTRIAYTRTPNVRSLLPFSPRREGHPWSIRVLEVATSRATEIWRALPGKGSVLHRGVPAIDNVLFWTGNKILFPWERNGWIQYYSVSERGGEPVHLTPGDGEVEQASLSADRQRLLYSTNINDIDRRHIWSVPVDSGKPQLLSPGTGIEWNAVETSQGIACLRADGTIPAWPHLIDGKGKITMLAASLFPKDFPTQSLVAPQAVSFLAGDGMKIPAQLFLPRHHKPGQKHPAVIFFHGGSRRQMLLGFHHGLYYHHAYALNQYLASLGYVVLSVNYRSGIGYGLDFREALDYGAAGASEFHDVKGAGEFLKSRSDVVASAIGLWGGSYGGYLTALGLSRAPELFSCGVDIHGVHDWNVVIRNFVPSYQAEKQQAFAKKAFESSPMNFVASWKAPVLLIHGDDDRNVPFSETVSLAESLRTQQVYFEQLIFPDEVHSFLLHENWVRAYQASADFFKRYLANPSAQNQH